MVKGWGGFVGEVPGSRAFSRKMRKTRATEKHLEEDEEEWAKEKMRIMMNPFTTIEEGIIFGL